MPECGIDDYAEVVAIEPCPEITEPLPGYRMVIGTFRHESARMIEVRLAGQAEPIGVTGNHPLLE